MRLMSPKRLANQLFDSIALNGRWYDSRGDGETEPWMVELIRANQHSEELTGMTARHSLAKYPVEIGFAA